MNISGNDNKHGIYGSALPRIAVVLVGRLFFYKQ